MANFSLIGPGPLIIFGSQNNLMWLWQNYTQVVNNFHPGTWKPRQISA